MITVITYGTFDLLHHGHIKLLERAKKLGDYLIVGVTSDDFDKVRGKINVQQPLIDRLEAVRATGLADKIIVEEYEGQKIDDIIRYNADVFTVGSDWIGKFDYLNDYCKVIYLPRTEGVSSSEIRSTSKPLRLGIVGQSMIAEKIVTECNYVNGMDIGMICTNNDQLRNSLIKGGVDTSNITNSYEQLLKDSDAVFILSSPEEHYEQIKQALNAGCSVICESPVVTDGAQWKELNDLAKEKNLILMESIKTAHSTAYKRLILLAKSGKIGDVVSVDCTCTTLRDKAKIDANQTEFVWDSMEEWGPTAMLPIFQLLGTEYDDYSITTCETSAGFNIFTKIDFRYPNAVASVRLGSGVKSEGELVISGTEGYIYVPSPWWKTEYFEIRYEDQNTNKRYFYKLDGEGIRNELVDFIKMSKNDFMNNNMLPYTTKIIDIFKDYKGGKDVKKIGQTPRSI